MKEQIKEMLTDLIMRSMLAYESICEELLDEQYSDEEADKFLSILNEAQRIFEEREL